MGVVVSSFLASGNNELRHKISPSTCSAEVANIAPIAYVSRVIGVRVLFDRRVPSFCLRVSCGGARNDV